MIPYDRVKLPPIETYVTQVSFGAATSNNFNNYSLNGPKNEFPDPERWHIISITNAGTAASNVSGSIVTHQNLEVVPWDGPIPYYELEMAHLDKVARIPVNPTEKKT